MARYALSSIYYYRQEYELATPQIDRAIEINPLASDGCLMVVGTAEYPMGRYDAALKAFGAMREAGIPIRRRAQPVAVAGGTGLSGQRIETQQRAVGFVGQQVEPSVRALAHVADARLQAFEQAFLVHDLFAIEFESHQHLAG